MKILLIKKYKKKKQMISNKALVLNINKMIIKKILIMILLLKNRFLKYKLIIKIILNMISVIKKLQKY